MAATAIHRLTLDPMGKCSNAFFSETTNMIKAKLYMNVHWMVLYKLDVFCFDMKFKMVATAGLTARTAQFSKKSLGSDVGEIKKMSEKLKKKSVLTPRNVREKWNTVIYYKTLTLTIKRREIKKWDINLYMFLRLSFLII